MVARILSGYSIRGLLNYNETKVESGDARLIMANRFAAEIEHLDPKAKLKRFERLTVLNGRAKRNAMHIMLNFDRSDKLKDEKLTQIASRYMEGIGFGEQPFLVYSHHDASHPHMHIVTTNIREDGSRIDFHNLGRTLSEEARTLIEQEFKLTVSKGRGKTLEPGIESAKIKKAIYGKRPTKQSIYNVVTPVWRSYAFTSFAEYNAILCQFNVFADRGAEDSLMFERKGLVYSIVDENGKRIGVPIKASMLAGKPMLSEIEKKFAKNTLKRKMFREPLKKSIDEVFNKCQQLTRVTFEKELADKGIATIFRKNTQGLIYGITFIDNKSRCVFNGSDLGKPYSAKMLSERLSQSDKPLVLEQPTDRSRYNLGKSGTNSPFLDAGNESSKESLLGILFEKPAFEPDPLSAVKKSKKKKHTRGQSNDNPRQI
ncbi:relaxase/mobilization nuclease domain-containing protein [Pedobacter mucosus]|uniref:relaxase/mobilization nuclease domain-containing protein n=1 Tax=Pedobacter mucosus TaxID=2895286 RepID=UPI001EE3E374|nr:relaxase/mobilization nuclease domain-containing protein [Pedobacter mucosus]UKT65045.1 relaxase/mobilization nuclease domain-containing protein [Pedobacter mucosus]